MSKCTSYHIRKYLDAYGWQYDDHDLGDSVVTGWQSERREYPLIVGVSDTAIAFRVLPLIPMEVEWQKWPEILQFLMELNDRSQFVKLSLTGDGEIVLSAHSLVENFGYDQLTRTLEIIGYYCDVFFDEIINQLQENGYQYHQPTEFLT